MEEERKSKYGNIKAGKPYKKKNNTVCVNFAIKDCPLWLYKWFIDEPTRYNDIYWVRLKELHDFIAMSQPLEEPKVETPLQEESEKKDSNKKSFTTFGGKEEFEIDEKEVE